MVMMAYQRVRVIHQEDLDRLYPLLRQYVQQPSLAELVTEISFDTHTWPNRITGYRSLSRTHQDEEWTESGELEHDDAHAAVQDYIRALGLSKGTTEKMMKILVWKRRYILDQWKGPDEKLAQYTGDFTHTATAVLLSLCPNVLTLYVGEIWSGSELREYLFKNNYDLLPRRGLQKLKQVEVITGSGGFPYYDRRRYGRVEFLDHFQAFHRLPSIESITMEGVAEYQASRKFFVPRTGNMTKIHIEHADLSSSCLETIISIPKALEELKFSMGGLLRRGGGHAVFYPGTIGQCLHQYKDTLRVLDLDVNHHISIYDLSSARGRNYSLEDEEVCDEEVRYYYKDESLQMDKESSLPSRRGEDAPHRGDLTLGSLHDFKQLSHLSVSLRALLGPNESWQLPARLAKEPPFRLVDILPPNLEYLCIYSYTKGDNEDVDKHVNEFMAKKSERFPFLKEIKGVDEMVPDLDTLHPARNGSIPDEHLWQRPKRDFDWVEINGENKQYD